MNKANFLRKTHQTLTSACSLDLSPTITFTSGLILLPILIGWLLLFILEEFVTKVNILRHSDEAHYQLICLSALTLYFILSTILIRQWSNIQKVTNILDFLALGSYMVYYLSTEVNEPQKLPIESSILYWEGITTECLVIGGTVALRKLPLKIIFFLGVNIYMLTLKMSTWEDRLYFAKLAGTLVSTVILFFIYRKPPQTMTYSPREFSNDTGIFRQILDQTEKGVAVISRDWQLLYKNDAFLDFVFSENEEDYDFKQALTKITGCTLQNPSDELTGRVSIPTSDQPLIRTTTERSTSRRAPSYKRSLFGSIIGMVKRSNSRPKPQEKPNLYEVIEKTLRENTVTIITSSRSTDRQSNMHTYTAAVSDTKTIQIKIRPVEDQDIPTVVVTISDYSIHERLNTLAAADRMHTISLASVTHELRAPLTSTMQFLETASSNENMPADAKVNNIEPALQNIKYTLILVNDILDFAQIKENKLKLTCTKINIVKLIEEASAIVSISCKNKKLHYAVNYLGVIPEEFVTDANRLKQVLVNLLNNAIKFTMKGSVRLTIETTSDKWISFSVKDTGIGIKPEDIKKLFKEYGKIELGDKQLLNLNGVGLGLNISNKLVKALSDEDLGIQVDSKYDKGSTFSFRIRNKNLQEQTTYVKTMTKADSTCVGRATTLYQRGITNGMTEEIRSNSFTQLKTMKTDKTAYKKKKPDDYSAYSIRDKHDRISSYLSSNHIELALGEKSDEENFGELANERVEAMSSSYYKKPILPVFPNESNFGPQQSPERRGHVEPTKDTIFLIDDDHLILMATSQIIQNMGIVCTQFYDVEEAVKQLLNCARNMRNYPGLMLIDYNMPYCTGAELAKMIRLIEKVNNIPSSVVIGLTGAGDNVEVQNACLEAGMDEVFEKPLTKAKLTEIIVKYGLDC